MNKPKLILTPVGALIVNRLSRDEKSLWDSASKEDLLAIREGQAKGQKALEQKVVTRLKTLDLTTEEGLQQASPEIKSLVKIGVGPEDQIVLYASETPDGILSARIIRDFAKQVWECTPTLEVITGLQVKDAGRFRSVGVLRYVQSIVKLIDNANNRYGREIILNATAGYKSLVPYTTLVGLLFQVPVQYIFETSSELLSLPPLPLDFDQQFFKQIEPLLEQIEQESSVEESAILKGLDESTRDKLLPLLEQENGQLTLSPLGFIVYERYKSPPPLMPSKRKSNEKDHTRDFSQETHRSVEFEQFKRRLAECRWVDEFWYLKGADESRKEVKQVGQELHVAFGGIELRAKVMATHESHYQTISSAIEDLMR